MQDARYLDVAPKKGELAIVWHDGTQEKKGTLPLADKWRQTDVSWRWSLKSLAPNPSIIGDDLEPDERLKRGLDARQLAYRQMNFLTPTARHAGLQANDVILGIDDRPFAMSARQFEMHIRLHYQVGQEITLNVSDQTRREGATETAGVSLRTSPQRKPQVYPLYFTLGGIFVKLDGVSRTPA